MISKSRWLELVPSHRYFNYVWPVCLDAYGQDQERNNRADRASRLQCAQISTSLWYLKSFQLAIANNEVDEDPAK